MKTLFEDTVANVIEVHPKGKCRLAKMMYIMCLGDFVSCYLAILRNIDPTPVDIITELSFCTGTLKFIFLYNTQNVEFYRIPK